METPQGGAITFENAFVDNATRTAADPSTTTDKLTAFDVWGFVKEYDGTVFVDQDVTHNGVAWGYEGTQFWAPNQPYYFAALAPMNSENLGHVLATGEAAKLGLGTLTFTNENGTEDVLYATSQVTSKGANMPNDPVKFQFKHLLSKVKFTFKNGFITNNASVKVTNIKMTAPAKASINVAQADYSKAWTLENEKVTLAFGDVQQLTYGQDAECADERLTIPATSSYVYTITFDVELFMGAQSVYNVSKTSTVTGVELEMGKAYNFSAEINPDNLELDTITFDVIEVEDWTPAAAGDEFVAAAQFGGTINLTEDVVVKDLVNVSHDLVVNLNGKTLAYEGDNRLFKVTDGATLTINGDGGAVTVHSDNLTASTTAAYIGTAYENSKIIINGGTHTTNGCTLYHANGGTVEINGGTFAATEEGYVPAGKYGYKYTLNVQGANGAIVVRGGSFLNYNPAHSEGENPAANFLADGYSAAADGEWFVVVPGTGITAVIDEVEDVLTTFATANAVIYMEEGNYVLTKKMSLASGVTLYGNGSSIKNDWASLAFNTQTTLKNVTVVDVNFTNNTVFDMAYADGELSFENCVFSHDRGNQSIHLDGKAGAKVVFDNCTFYGRNMYAANLDKVIFNNCKFLESTWMTEQQNKGKTDCWNGVNMWGKYEFNNCQFDKACTCNVKTNGVEADFNDCTYTDGSDITGVVKNSSNYTATINFN